MALVGSAVARASAAADGVRIYSGVRPEEVAIAAEAVRTSQKKKLASSTPV
jgi:hypothetical protein